MKPILPIQRTNRQAAAYYNRLSHIYDWLTSSEKKFTLKGIDLLNPQAGETILEIGTGTGASIPPIQAQIGSQGRYFGLDLAKKMLEKAQEKTMRDHFLLVQGDGAHLPFLSGQFDGGFCAFTLELFPTPLLTQVLAEFHRILKINGRLVIVAMVQSPRTFGLKIYETAHKLFPVAVDCRPIPLINLLKAAPGFDILKTSKKMNWGLPIQIALSIKTGK